MNENEFGDRLAAVERAISGGETDCRGLEDEAERAARLDELEAAVDDLEDRLATVEASTEALRGYVSGIDAVNEAVERQANAALAAVERLESVLEGETDPALTVERATVAGDFDGAEATTDDRDDSSLAARIRRAL